MKPLVSIIVPVYNVGEYVLKCLESLTNQSYERIEIIAVDDGSTDGSGETCDEFAKKDKRIKVFHKKNGGLSSARNFGIKKAKGDYICLVDSDDYVKKDFVKKLVNAAKKCDADIVVCGFNNEVPEAQKITGEDAAIRLLLEQNNMEVIAWNKMYKRVLFDDVLYPEGRNYEDTLTTYKLLSKADIVAYVGESLYVYVERGGSITNKDKKEEKLKSREQAAKEAASYFKRGTDLLQAAEIAMLTAKLAWVDFAISGDVDKSYLQKGMKWVKDHKGELHKNKFLSKKLKLYIWLVDNWGGRLYVVFRKIRHE
ncbi:glycosyltransferase family 2 protein [Candidatus Saccharibacteria bacterium]|nr:glycosyltransferase family 2 protein [Candidatus Saccharibacteria bacterium]